VKAPALSQTSPALVSDLTAPAILGLPNRRAFEPFLDEIGVASTKIGRRRFARLDAILRAIDARTGATTAPEWSEDNVIALAAGKRGAR
jgi:hypothetical protein